MSNQIADHQEEKYDLQLLSYPDEQALVDTCRLIYKSTDQTLLAAMTSTPYTVGRSFGAEDYEEIHHSLVRLGVRHRFTERNSGRKIEFHQSSEDPETQRVSNRPDLGKALKLIKLPALLISILILGILAITLYQNKKSETKSENLPASLVTPSKDLVETNSGTLNFEAQLQQLRNKVEIRLATSISWSEAEENEKLKSRDSIRTSSDSSASLVYRSGSLVNILPNSLVVVGKSSEDNQSREDEIRLSSGDLNARLQQDTKPAALKIQTDKGQIQMNSETGSVQLRTSMTNGELKVQVAKGTASFSPTSSTITENAEPIQLRQNKQLSIEPQGQAHISEYIPSLKLLSPKSESNLEFSESQDQVFHFQWEDLGIGGDYQFIVSSSKDLTEPLVNQTTKENSIDLTYLDSGDLYWGVRGNLDSVVYQSPTWRIHVQQELH